MTNVTNVSLLSRFSGYAPGTPFKMSCSPNTGTVPPYSSSPNPYHAAVYPVRSTYPQQNPYAQVLLDGPYGSSNYLSIIHPSFHQSINPSISIQFLDFLILNAYNYIPCSPFSDPGINTITTAGHLLHTAAVCCAASCYTPHNGGPAKWDASSHVCAHYPSAAPQRCRHGDGSWYHHGHVCW